MIKHVIEVGIVLAVLWFSGLFFMRKFEEIFGYRREVLAFFAALVVAVFVGFLLANSSTAAFVVVFLSVWWFSSEPIARIFEKIFDKRRDDLAFFAAFVLSILVMFALVAIEEPR